ncbi:retrovirus-related pol polyprotein from transposon TNT 1-94 [Tanacetum coccineum]
MLFTLTVMRLHLQSDVLMAKLSSYDSDILLEVPIHDNYLDNHVIDQNVQEMQYSEQPVFNNDTYIDITSDNNMISYEQYLKETVNTVVQDTSSSAQQDAMIMSVIKEMTNQVAKCNEVDKENKIINESLIVELERYKQQIKLFEERQQFDLNDSEKYIDSQLRKVVVDKNAKVMDFENQIDSLKQQLNATVESYKTLSTMVDHFVRQKQLLVEQAFWLTISKLVSEIPPVQPEPVLKEIPRELPIISFVKDSFNKRRSHVNDFKNVVTVCTKVAPEFPAFFEINELKAQLQAKNNSIRKLKGHIATLKGKGVSECDKYENISKVITPGMYKIDLEPLSLKLLKNRKAQIDYLNHTQEHADTLHEIVEHARALKPLDSDLDSDCRTFTIDGNTCHLARISSTTVVPPKKPLSTTLVKKNPPSSNTLRKLKNITNIGRSNHPLIGNFTISWLYYVEGLGQNLFSVGQFCDSDLKVAFRKHTCYVRDLEGVDLLKGSRGSNLYTMSLEEMMQSSPICLLSKASKTKSWLWHRSLSHLNFRYINELVKQGLVRGLPKLKYQKDHLCSTYSLGNSKKHNHKLKYDDSIKEKLYFLHMNLCGPIRIESINVKKYILLIVVDYSSSRLVHNPPSLTPYVPPTKNDWDILFQPMFDEYFNPPPSVASPVLVAVALRPADPNGTPSSTSIDQATPSTSTSSTIQESQSLVISKGVKERLQLAQLIDDPFLDILTSEPSS